ncbi:MAG: hypothetical protein VB049_10125 [Candidatus Pelethousia sp.]|nr:hypothetical protein [Candidatus Pelethousia sp.]
MKKIKAQILFPCVLLAILCGCSAAIPSQVPPPSFSAEEEKPPSEPTANGLPPSSSESVNESEQENGQLVFSHDAIENEVTPYQFLYLLCGNAAELSFTYTVLHPTAANTETRLFQRKGDISVECYPAQDMNGNLVSVRELEMGEKVHYILDESKIIRTYLAPAEDFLLYRMLEAAEAALACGVNEDGSMLYACSLSFGQDETMRYNYRFFMQDGTLKKLTVALDDTPETIYVFSEFQQDITDEAAFTYPKGYAEQVFDYGYTEDSMPPWWEIGNEE